MSKSEQQDGTQKQRGADMHMKSLVSVALLFQGRGREGCILNCGLVGIL